LEDNRNKKRMHLIVTGTVQGVGFRPFVYRLANSLGLTGWIRNSSAGVQIEVEGNVEQLDDFASRLQAEKPPHANIHTIKTTFLEPIGDTKFEVLESELSGQKTAIVLPDIAICPDCLREIFDPQNRRYHYSFTNCTNCGPRYSIIESLPYDRVNTTMKIFPMCYKCRAEYEDPNNRRFHAQPNACPECGPHLELWNTQGKTLAIGHDALLKAVDAICNGQILALKGLGGFQLLVDAQNEEIVAELRRRKGREEKPFATMYPHLELILQHCHVSPQEQELLCSAESPIVLLKQKFDRTDTIAPSVAPDNSYLGIMLPYTPLHHLLMAELNIPIVATSGNLSDEPICIDEQEAIVRLKGIADLYLIHNRPIARQMDDSVARVILGQKQILRLARGYAPKVVDLKRPVSPCLATGAHLKNCVAVSIASHAVISQHIGDLETPQAYEAMIRVTDSLSRLYEFTPKKTACDMHPDYLSTKFAATLNIPVTRVQHHYAHVLSCMADNQLTGSVLGVSWDGTGWGTDETVWGGEFLRADEKSFTRLAHFRTFRLPGGETAIREPRRSALGLLYEIFGEDLHSMKEVPPPTAFDHNEKQIVLQMLDKKINSPLTSSAGRLFDAIASLLDICHITRSEGKAAMQLEFLASGEVTEKTYPFVIKGQSPPYIIDWEPMVRSILDDIKSSASKTSIAAVFHNTLVEIMVDVAKLSGEKNIVLTGGCFQNRYLTEHAVARLTEVGFKPFWHHDVPPNDGGIALGQLVAAINIDD